MKNKLIYIVTFFLMFFVCIFIASVSNATYGPIFSQYVYMESDGTPKPTKSGEEYGLYIPLDNYTRTINYYVKKDELRDALNNNKINFDDLANEVVDMQEDYGEDSDEAKKTDDFYALCRHAKDVGINTVIGDLPDLVVSENGNVSRKYNTEKKVDQNDTDEMKKSYTAEEIKKYVTYSPSGNGEGRGINGESDEVKAAWEKTLNDNPDIGNAILSTYYKYDINNLKTGRVYRQPTVTTSTTDSNLDDVISDGESFLKDGSNNKINKEQLSKLSGNLYNILLTIGVAVAVIVGVVLGAKFIMASVEEKAVVKEGLISYAAGCVIVFGAFAIWKIAVTLLQSI